MDFQSDFYLNGWKIQPHLNRIVKNDVTTTLEHRLMRVLICLAERAPEPVTRACLLEVAWPDLHTTEHSLTAVISELRKAFEDDPRRPQLIETIRKIGYRLMVVPTSFTEGNLEETETPPPSKKKKNRLGWALLLLAVIPLLYFLAPDPDPCLTPNLSSNLTSNPLTSYPGGEFDPSISPQGNALAFVWSGDTNNFDIYLKDLDGETPLRLTELPGFDGSPVWSPDGQEIAYMSSNGQDCGIFITSITGGDRQRIADCNYRDESSLDWSADGRYLVFSDRLVEEGPAKLFLLNRENGQISTLTEPTENIVGDRDPCFSPDSRKIAFVRGNLPSTVAAEISPVFGDLYVIDIETRIISQITRGNMELPGVTWMPDGKALIFASNRDGGDYSLFHVPAEGGQSQTVLRGTDLVRNPSIGSDQHILVYEAWERDTNIWRLSLDKENPKNEQPQQFIFSTRSESHPEYSPDGQKIAFVSRRSGHPEIWVCGADGSLPTRITRFEGASVNVPRWSPDSASLAFAVRKMNQSHIFTMALSTKATPVLVISGSGYQMAPSWSADGNHLYYGANRNGFWQVWKTPTKGGDPVLQTPKGGFQAFELGDYLYFSQLNRRGIWRQPLEGGEPEILIQQMISQDWDNWTVRQEGIYFIRRDNLNSSALCFYAFPSGPIQDLLNFKTHRILGKNGLSISPDGKWALFTKLDRFSGDLMQAEGFITEQ